eukprot:SAG11_NODE_1781_length_4262_cov_5.146049_2_plen_700_part_00
MVVEAARSKLDRLEDKVSGVEATLHSVVTQADDLAAAESAVEQLQATVGDLTTTLRTELEADEGTMQDIVTQLAVVEHKIGMQADGFEVHKAHVDERHEGLEKMYRESGSMAKADDLVALQTMVELLAASVNSLTATVQAELEADEGTMQDIVTQLAAVEQKIGMQADEIKVHKAHVDERQEGLEKMHLEASSAAAKVDELSVLQAAVLTLRSTVSELSSTVGSNDLVVGQIVTQLAAVGEKIEMVEEKAVAIEGQVVGVEMEVGEEAAALDARVDGLQLAVEAVTTKGGLLEQDLVRFHGSVDKALRQLGSTAGLLEADLTNLQTTLDAAPTREGVLEMVESAVRVSSGKIVATVSGELSPVLGDIVEMQQGSASEQAMLRQLGQEHEQAIGNVTDGQKQMRQAVAALQVHIQENLAAVESNAAAALDQQSSLLSQLAAAVQAVSSKVAPLEEKVIGVASAVDTVKEDMAQLGSAVPRREEVASGLDQQSSLLSQLAAAVQAVSDKVAPLEEKVIGVASAVDTVKEDMAQLGSAVPRREEVASGLDQQASLLSQLAAAVQAVSGKVAPLEEKVIGVASAVDTVKEDMAQLGSAVPRREEVGAAVGEQVAQVAGKLAAVEQGWAVAFGQQTVELDKGLRGIDTRFGLMENDVVKLGASLVPQQQELVRSPTPSPRVDKRRAAREPLHLAVHRRHTAPSF